MIAGGTKGIDAGFLIPPTEIIPDVYPTAQRGRYDFGERNYTSFEFSNRSPYFVVLRFDWATRELVDSPHLLLKPWCDQTYRIPQGINRLCYMATTKWPQAPNPTSAPASFWFHATDYVAQSAPAFPAVGVTGGAQSNVTVQGQALSRLQDQGNTKEPIIIANIQGDSGNRVEMDNDGDFYTGVGGPAAIQRFWRILDANHILLDPAKNISSQTDPDTPGALARKSYVDAQDNTRLPQTNPAVAGVLSIGGGDGFLARPTASSLEYRLQNNTGTIVLSSNSANLAGNCFFDGTNWQRIDTTKAAYVLAVSPSGALLYSVGAGANPITFPPGTPLATGSSGQFLPLSGGTLSGTLFFRSNNAYVDGVNANNDVRLAASRYAFLDGATAPFLTANCYYDGTNWQRYNTAQPAAALQMNANANVYIFTAPAGANPINFASFPLNNDQTGSWSLPPLPSTAYSWYTTSRGYRLKGGIVEFSGGINIPASVPANTAIITLPAGFRPPVGVEFGCSSNLNGYQRVGINTSGVLFPVVATPAVAGYIALDAIRFAT